MKQESKVTLRKYAVCVGIEAVIAFLVIWANGFFTQDIAVNIQIISDACFTAGILMTSFACMMYISGEGALIGIGYILRHVVLTFIPMGRMKHEKYIDYRARKLGKSHKHNDRCILITGLIFVLAGVIFTVVWYVAFYNA